MPASPQSNSYTSLTGTMTSPMGMRLNSVAPAWTTTMSSEASLSATMVISTLKRPPAAERFIAGVCIAPCAVKYERVPSIPFTRYVQRPYQPGVIVYSSRERGLKVLYSPVGWSSVPSVTLEKSS